MDSTVHYSILWMHITTVNTALYMNTKTVYTVSHSRYLFSVNGEPTIIAKIHNKISEMGQRTHRIELNIQKV
jgi:hypothetical protein